MFEDVFVMKNPWHKLTLTEYIFKLCEQSFYVQMLSVFWSVCLSVYPNRTLIFRAVIC